MARPRRFIYLPDLARSRDDGFAAAQEAQFAACPEAAEYSDQEVEDFLAAAFYLDHASRQDIVCSLHKTRIAIPPELAFDEYRLCRCLLRKWRDPQVRDTFFGRGVDADWSILAGLARRSQAEELVFFAKVHGIPVTLSIMRRYGMNHLVPNFVDGLPDAQKAWHRALMLHGRLLLHRCLTDPEPPRPPSPWEVQKLNRRLRLRDVQLQAMRKSRHRLRRERNLLLSRLRSAGRKECAELAALATELAGIQAQRTAARRRHEAALAEQAQQHGRIIRELQADLAAARQDHARTLAERARWLPAGRRGS